MTVGIEKLVRMAEQIAANISVSDEPQVVADAVASHLHRFWDPRMRERFVLEAAQGESLSPVLREVLAILKTAQNARL